MNEHGCPAVVEAVVAAVAVVAVAVVVASVDHLVVPRPHLPCQKASLHSQVQALTT